MELVYLRRTDLVFILEAPFSIIPRRIDCVPDEQRARYFTNKHYENMVCDFKDFSSKKEKVTSMYYLPALNS